MAQTITLSRRLTRCYVGACAHLDRWRDVGTARVLPARQVRAPGMDQADLGELVLWARIPRGQDAAASRQALADYYDRWGCHHEYDCCGCLLCRATVRQVSRRDFVVHLSVGRNY